MDKMSAQQVIQNENDEENAGIQQKQQYDYPKCYSYKFLICGGAELPYTYNGSSRFGHCIIYIISVVFILYYLFIVIPRVQETYMKENYTLEMETTVEDEEFFQQFTFKQAMESINLFVTLYPMPYSYCYSINAHFSTNQGNPYNDIENMNCWKSNDKITLQIPIDKLEGNLKASGDYRRSTVFIAIESGMGINTLFFYDKKVIQTDSIQKVPQATNVDSNILSAFSPTQYTTQIYRMDAKIIHYQHSEKIQALQTTEFETDEYVFSVEQPILYENRYVVGNYNLVLLIDIDLSELLTLSYYPDSVYDLLEYLGGVWGCFAVVWFFLELINSKLFDSHLQRYIHNQIPNHDKNDDLFSHEKIIEFQAEMNQLKGLINNHTQASHQPIRYGMNQVL